MSLESAIAVLDKAMIKSDPIPGVNPDTATVVTDKVADAVKDLKVDIKTDSLKPTEPTKTEDTKTETPKEEPAKDDKKEAKPEDNERMSQRFAHLAKKEKELYTRTQALKTQEQAITEKLAAIENFEKFKAEVHTNPMLALKELGVTYDDLTKYVLSGKMPTGEGAQVEAIRKEMQALRDEMLNDKKAAEEAKAQAVKADAEKTVAAFRSEIGDYIKGNSDKFELTNLYEASNLVYQAIENHFNDTQRIMSIEEGCEIVEKYLEEQASKVLAAKKFAAKVNPAPNPVPKPAPTAQSRTLNNDMTSSAPSLLPAKTEQDRMRRAMAALTQAG